MCLSSHLSENSSENRLAEVTGKMKGHFLTSWTQLSGRVQCIKISMNGVGSQTEETLRGGGLWLKAPLTRWVMRVITDRHPINVGQSHRNSRPMQIDCAVCKFTTVEMCEIVHDMSYTNLIE
jgi:hypothetical protein